MGRLVVGIDSSADSARALRWALDEAVLRGAEVELVHAYPTPEIVALPAIVTMPTDDELRAGAEEIVRKTLAEVGGPGDVPVTTTVRPGGSARVLCEVAEGAELLVVGARGLGGFRGLLLGSVSQQVVAHAPCPVLITVREKS
jgi:nucleotide-binding universal stress UspA family protein